MGVITKETLWALPSNYILSQSTSYHLHCTFLVQTTIIFTWITAVASQLVILLLLSLSYSLLATEQPEWPCYNRSQTRLLLYSEASTGFLFSERKSWSCYNGLQSLTCSDLQAPLWPHPVLIPLCLSLILPYWPFCFSSEIRGTLLPWDLGLPVLLPRESLSYLPHLLRVFAQMSPSQWSLPGPPKLIATFSSKQIANAPISLTLLFFP